MVQREKAISEIDLDGKNAEQKLKDLQKEAKLLKKEIKDLRSQPLMNPALIRQAEQELIKVRKEINKTQKDVIDVRAIMNDLSGTTVRKLEQAYNKLRAARKNISQSDPKFKEITNDMKRLKAQIDKANSSIREQQSLLSRASNLFSKYSGIILSVIASITGLLFSVRRSIDEFIKLEEKLADVMKTTNLTREEVDRLNIELAKINTRSSQLELLDLARVAGKLGISVREDILGFVRATDKIGVALAADLGGNVEHAATVLGKLVDIFKLKDIYGIEEALLKVGSVINSLGMTGTANEQYLVEFSRRVAGIAPMANISIDNILGLGATLDELGQTSEVASTTYSKVMADIFKNTDKYAKLAGMSIDEYNKLLKEDANEAFIKFLEGAKGSDGTFKTLINSIKDLSLNGARSTAVLGALANNTDLLRERQAFANVEFIKGNSIQEEFNIKNNTAEAKRDKALKTIKNISVELGKKLYPVYTSIISKSSTLLKTTSAIVDILYKYSGIIITTTAALAGYWIVIKTANFWDITYLKTKALLINSWRLLKGEISLTVKAQEAWNKLSKTNKIALIVSGITALVTGLSRFTKIMDKTAASTKLLSDVNKTLEKTTTEATAALLKEKEEVNKLFEPLKNELLSKDEKLKLINKINSQYETYLPFQLTEKSNLDDIAEAQKTVNQEITNNILLKAKNQALDEVALKAFDQQAKIIKEMENAFVKAGYSESKAIENTKLWVEELQKMVKGDKFLKFVDLFGEGFETMNQKLGIRIGGTGFDDFQIKLANVLRTTNKGMKEIDRIYDLLGLKEIRTKTIVNPEFVYNDDDPENEDIRSNKNIEKEIWEMAQFQESMIMDAGRFYADYLLKRKSVDQSYFTWKKQQEIEISEYYEALLVDDAQLWSKYLKSRKSAEQSYFEWRQGESFHEWLKILTEESNAEILEQKKLLAQGKITQDEYNNYLLSQKGSVLLNEKTLREQYGEELNDINKKIADYEIEVEEYKTDKLKALRNKELEEQKIRADKIMTITKEMGDSIGSILGDSAMSAEEKQRELAKSLLKIALQTLKNTLDIAIAQSMMKEVSSKGLVGLLSGGALSLALNTVYSLAVSKISGFQEGGFTPSGDPGKVAGVIHSNEYVIPYKALKNPDIRKIINIIEAARVSNKLNSIDFDTLFQMPALYSGSNSVRQKSYDISNNTLNKSNFEERKVVFDIPDEFYNIMNKLSKSLDSLDKIEAIILYDKQRISDKKIGNAEIKSNLN